MARDKLRRAAGSKTFSDLFFHLGQNKRVAAGLPATDPELDLVHLSKGEPLAVAAHRRVDDRLRPGTLVLHSGAADPLVWFPGRFPRRAGSGTALRAPLDVVRTYEVGGADAWKVKRWMYIMVDLSVAGEAWTIAVPTFDLDLVRAAISATRW